MKTALKICAAVFGIIGVVFLAVGIGVCYTTGLRWPMIHVGLGAVFLILSISFVLTFSPVTVTPRSPFKKLLSHKPY